MIGRNGERWSGISAQAARHDDDDDSAPNRSCPKVNAVIQLKFTLAYKDVEDQHLRLYTMETSFLSDGCIKINLWSKLCYL